MIKKLKYGLKKITGKNNFGHLTVYHRGGGHKKSYRIINFYNNKLNLTGVIKTIEYDPNRSSYISLICYNNGLLNYILTPNNLKVGDKINNNIEFVIGNRVLLGDLYKGAVIHNLSFSKKKKSQLIRSAGTSGIVLNKFLNKYTVVKLPSGEFRAFLNDTYCILGTVSNIDFKNKKLYKAGQNRWKNKRPVVRGVAMNPIDHPHGGGEGKSSGGHPKTPWGFPTKGGYKTRSKKKNNKHIIKRKKNVN